MKVASNLVKLSVVAILKAINIEKTFVAAVPLAANRKNFRNYHATYLISIVIPGMIFKDVV